MDLSAGGHGLAQEAHPVRAAEGGHSVVNQRRVVAVQRRSIAEGDVRGPLALMGGPIVGDRILLTGLGAPSPTRPGARATTGSTSSSRRRQVATLAFAGGDVIEPLKIRKATNADRRCGTSARAWPDAKYFESGELPKADLTHLLRSKAVLMPGVTVTLNGNAYAHAAMEGAMGT